MVLPHSFTWTSIYRIGLQQLKIIWSITKRRFSTRFLLRVRRNGYLWTVGVNPGTVVRFPNHDFLAECDISVIWDIYTALGFHLLKVHHISTSDYLRRKYTKRVGSHGDNFHQIWSKNALPLPSWEFLLLMRYVTLRPWPLTFWLWTVLTHGESCGPPSCQSWKFCA